jgi:hypothetical protein
MFSTNAPLICAKAFKLSHKDDKMTINNVVGLFAALIGSTATLLGAWAYIRSQHPPRGKMIRAALAITVIMIGILGTAVIISRATTITVNGQKTIPVPYFLAPATTPTPSSTSLPTPTIVPSPTQQLPTPTIVPSPTQQLPTPTIVPSTTLIPSTT